MEKVLEIKNLSKFYPPNLWAIKDISLSFEKGLIHAIIGENGAGKSTLMKICYGLIPYDDGEIFLNGETFEPKNPQHTLSQGIGMVHQEFMLFDDLTVYENILLGYESTNKLGLLNRKEMKAIVQQKNEYYNFNLNINSKIKNLSVAAKQKVELLKLLFLDSSLLIFDEPTSVLTPQECKDFFDYLSILKKNGKTIFYIGHKLEDILQISDTVTILRKGSLIAHYTSVNNLSKSQLVADMIGTQELGLSERNTNISDNIILSIKNLNLSSTDEFIGLKNINMDIREGEIVGIAAIEGHGQSELVQAIIGVLTEESGKIILNNEDISRYSLEKRRQMISFVSPNRNLLSSCQEESILNNIIMGHHKSEDFNKGCGFLNFKKLRAFYHRLLKEYHIVSTNEELPMSSLSGGNQQKVIVAREYELNNSLILLEQPTRGLDVNSIQYIHNLIINKRDEGKAVCIVSSDLDELFALSDTLLVMHRGQIVAKIDSNSLDLEQVGQLMLTGKTK